ncbi:hypothetical protein EI427_16185 [Flammeovirga pectinis]|uniref:Uncharacterized protein n=1 Tax=Flammeovirga pectinis TaxID=2494373 RepID=A0A3Q9FPY6_9BACT|nr:hypothetical protein [Flammeovirga pectinis]AZQ63705.1 hypothetical protein EI427_16185 [Flammeovirga pectinis]
MKKFIVTAFILCVSIIGYAQRGFSSFSPKELPEVITEQMTLDKDTEKKLNKSYIKLQEDVINTMILAKQEGEVDKATIKKEIGDIRAKHLKKAKGLLDEKDYSTYSSFVLMERKERQEYIVQLKLKLTPDQKEKFDAINASNEQVIAKIRKEHRGDREGMKEALMPIMKQQYQMYAQFLTEEQMEILKSLRKMKKGREQR